MPPKSKKGVAGGYDGGAPAAAKELDAGKAQGSSYRSRFATPKASGVTCSDPRMVSFVVEELKNLTTDSEEELLAKINSRSPEQCYRKAALSKNPTNPCIGASNAWL